MRRIQPLTAIQPADEPMAFTFCTLKEFPEMAKRWAKNPHPGVPTDREKSTYSGAFMPHLITPEED